MTHSHSPKRTVPYCLCRWCSFPTGCWVLNPLSPWRRRRKRVPRWEEGAPLLLAASIMCAHLYSFHLLTFSALCNPPPLRMQDRWRMWLGLGGREEKARRKRLPQLQFFPYTPSASLIEQKQSTKLCSRVQLLESSNFLLMCPQLVNINFVIIMNPHQGNNKHLSVYTQIITLKCQTIMPLIYIWGLYWIYFSSWSQENIKI